MTDSPLPRWHQALTWALTGEPAEDLGRQAQPDLAALAAEFAAAGPEHLTRLRASIALRRSKDEPWPYPVPEELMRDVGAAQFGAALADLRRRLELAPPARPVLSSRAPDAAERRLLDDVPPHHGS